MRAYMYDIPCAHSGLKLGNGSGLLMTGQLGCEPTCSIVAQCSFAASELTYIQSSSLFSHGHIAMSHDRVKSTSIDLNDWMSHVD